MSTTRGAVAAPPTGFWDRQNDLFRGMMQAILADPTAFADIPRGAFVILIPHDADETFHEASVEARIDSLRKGRNVYLRHVAPGELSETDAPEIEGTWEDYVVKREHFDPPCEDDETVAEDSSR